MLEHPWKIGLLGGLRLDDGAGNVIERFPTRKTALLLARLALGVGRPAEPRETLADLLWPDAAPEAARHSLRQAVNSLRRLLEPPGTPRGSVLVAHGNHALSLHRDAVDVDVAAFEAARRDADRAGKRGDGEARRALLLRARALYAGDLLPGHYEDWVLSERGRLADAFEALLREVGAEGQEGGPVPTPPPSPHPSPATVSAPLLPAPLTRFFGRDDELGLLSDLLPDPQARLVTLTGPGGSGKTRLAVEATRRLAHRFPGAVAFVTLNAEEAGEARLAATLRAALAAGGLLPARPDGEPLPEVAARLAAGPSLLLLDNFEQAAPGEGAAFVRALLERAPPLTCLVTSRRALGVSGERELPVAPLPVPEEEEARGPEPLLALPSVALFVDRARAVRPDFQVTERNAAAMSSLCRRLEGIPLAIELAAARARALSPAQILTHLEDRFAFLRSRDPNAPARHRTLLAAVDGSVRVLPPADRRLFLRLAVFRGGWTLDTAHGVAADEGAEPLGTLGALERLCQASLIVPAGGGGDDEARFRMLDTLREYALAELGPDEAAHARRRHADCFAALAERAATEGLAKPGPVQEAALRALDTERDNLRAAAAALSAAGDAPGRLRLAAALAPYWMLRGELREGRAALADTFAATEGVTPADLPNALPLRARVADALGAVCARSGDFAAAAEASRASLAISRGLGDDFGVARSLNNLGSMSLDRMEWTEGAALLEEGLTHARRVGNPQLVAGMRNNLALALLETGRLDEAAALWSDNLALRREAGDARGAAITLLNLADLSMRRGDGAEACRLYGESLALYRDAEDPPQTAIALEGLAEALAASADAPVEGALRAAFALGAARALRERTGASSRPQFAAAYPALEARLCGLLGADGFARRFEEGHDTPLDAALAEVIGAGDGVDTRTAAPVS